MINYLLMLFLTLPSFCAYCQSFEGVLKYKMTIETDKALEKAGLTKEMIIDKMKEEGVFLEEEIISYKGGNYCISSIAGKKISSVYRKDKNKIYAFEEGTDICAVTDASIDAETKLLGKKPEITILDTTAVIYNKPCKIVRVKWNTSYYDYYFSQDFLTMDPELYANHVYDGWAEYLKISKSLPLQIVKSVNGMMRIISTLEDVQVKPVDDALFALPKMTADKDVKIPMASGKTIMRIKK